MRKRVRLIRKNLFNYILSGSILDHHSSLTVSRTCEAFAVAEVHFLHAHGEHELSNVPYGRGKERRKRVKNEGRRRRNMRNEGRAEAGRKNYLIKYDLYSYPNSAVPVRASQ